MHHLQLAIAQLNVLVGDIAGNAELIIRTAERARDELAADCVLFPELALCGYPPEDLLFRAGFAAQVAAAVAQIQRSIHGITVVFGYPEFVDQHIYNAAAVMRDGEQVGNYRKACLPNYGVFDEARYFTAGNAPCVITLGEEKLGITICEDIWFTQPAAAAAEAGATVLLNLNASPFHLGKAAHREQQLRARAQETNLPIVYANLVGGQDELVFDGQSLVANAQGDVIQRLPAFTDALTLADFTAAPQPPLAADETGLVYDALVCGIRDYIEKNHFPGVVVGLSGGVDSALTLVLAVDAIGAERVEAVLMPSRYTRQISIDDAVAEAELLGVAHQTLSIEPAFNSFLDSLQPRFDGLPADTTEENIQARCRGVLLMAISNKTGKMVLTTGNKSEMSVGYATLYGDMAGGFAPLKDVPKMLVYALCRYRNTRAPAIPERVLTRAPSAELRDDQQDSDSLPDYAVLDEVLERWVEHDEPMHDIIAAGFDAQMVERIVKLVRINEYKRRQAPPGVKITARAFGRDRRYPITSGYQPVP